MSFRTVSRLSIGLTLVAHGAVAADKPTQFWNLISSTVTSFQLAKAGGADFGPNLEANDADGATDHDERLKLPGVATGDYDAKLALKDGRTCFARNVKITAGKPFSLENRNLVECAKS